MAFGNSEDPRYRGNRKVYASLSILAGVAVLVVAGLFLFRGQDRAPGTDESKTPPPSPSATPLSSAESTRQDQLKELRAELTKSRDWAKVEALAREILALEPEDAQGWSYVGRAQEAQGNLGEAMKSYEHAADAPGRTYYDLYLKARLYRKLGDQPKAISTLEAAREMKTDSVILSNLILIYRIEDGQSEAVRSLVRTYEDSGIQSNVDQWLGAAGALALHDGKKAEAAMYLQKFRGLVNPEIYQIFVSDAFFDQYRQQFPDIFADQDRS